MRLFTTVFTASLFVLIAVVGLFEFIPCAIDTAADVGFVDFVLNQGVDALGVTTAIITPTIWVRDIAENLYPNNEFYMASRDDSDWLVNGGNKVELPQAGAKPGVEKNRASVPATPAQRVDTTGDYTVDEFTTDPVLLKHTEEVEVSYNKRESLMFDHIETLREEIAGNFIEKWQPSLASNIIRTSGTSRAAYRAGQTGNRKAVAKNDFINAQRLMNRMDIPQSGRCCLIDADMYSDLLKIEEFVSLEKIGSAKLTEGAVGRLLGFDIFVRSTGAIYDNTGTPVGKAYDAAVNAADNLGAMFWHPFFVRRALGNEGNGGIVVFEKEKDPQFYGDVFSALVRAGGRKARTDEKGVIVLVEEAA